MVVAELELVDVRDDLVPLLRFRVLETFLYPRFP